MAGDPTNQSLGQRERGLYPQRASAWEQGHSERQCLEWGGGTDWCWAQDHGSCPSDSELASSLNSKDLQETLPLSSHPAQPWAHGRGPRNIPSGQRKRSPFRQAWAIDHSPWVRRVSVLEMKNEALPSFHILQSTKANMAKGILLPGQRTKVPKTSCCV